MKKIGFIKSIYYYLINPYWKKFFSESGFEVIVIEGERQTLPGKVNTFENELCLPMKYLLSQVEDLKRKNVDYIFAPHVPSVKKGVFCCPKVIITPELIKLYYDELPELLMPVINIFDESNRYAAFKELAFTLARTMGIEEGKVEKSCDIAKDFHIAFDRYLYKSGLFYDEAEELFNIGAELNPGQNEMKILFLGHKYTVHNSLLNNNLINEIRHMGANPVSKEHMFLYRMNLNLKKEINLDTNVYFSEGAEVFRAAYLGAKDDSIKGIIYLSMFNCGFDAVMEDVISRRIMKGIKKPYLNFVLDEHSTKSNLLTRLEVYLDIINSRNKNKDFS